MLWTRCTRESGGNMDGVPASSQPSPQPSPASGRGGARIVRNLDCEARAVRMRPMLRAIFLKSLLVLALLFTQQGAVTHAIAHTLAEQSQDQSLPHDQQCELCAAYAQIGSALGSSSVQFDLASHQETARSTHSASFRPVAFAAFAARAPPRSA